MAKWSEIRAAIDGSVRAYFSIDEWLLDSPVPSASLYPNKAISYPATDLVIMKRAAGEDFSARLQYEIQYRVPEDQEYHDIPLYQFESLLLGGIAYVISQVPIGSQCTGFSSGVVVERAPSNLEWLLKLPIVFDVTGFSLEPDDTTSIQTPMPTPLPFEIVNITAPVRSGLP